jgi:hypothetical protein
LTEKTKNSLNSRRSPVDFVQVLVSILKELLGVGEEDLWDLKM